MKKLLITSSVSAILMAGAAMANDAGQLYTNQAPATPNVSIPVISDSGPSGSGSVSVGITSNGSAPTVSGIGVSGTSGNVSAGASIGTGGSVTVQGGYGGVSGSVTHTPMGPSVGVGFGGSF
ncbi:hypothetical protein [Shimia sp. MMG029]|uniref:hypothetical protein n=1 Tax=Shimia sp. MMG029 TaxID=3021978 RepID=UPI0022FF2F89|nr:hypothetical protein [Shimia sp. MMG029]MDA5558688.1 hypothetical protein [Shimia sp. MMG029]